MIENGKMKKILAIAIVAVAILTTVIYKAYNGKSISTSNTTNKTSANYESIFKKDKVIDIKVEISEKDLKGILEDPMAEEYKSAKVTVNGVTVENVGFRTKGNLTLKSVANTDSNRYSFRIKLDEYVEGQNLLGLDEFVVNNMYSDPSYMREYLSYEALREIGADVPEAVYTNLYINDELYGFYLCVEAVDDSFLERTFGKNDGNLYKQEQGSTLKYVEGSNYDKSELKSGDDDTKKDIKNLISTLNEMPDGKKGDIESVLDVNSALKYIAANTVLGNYDSYSGNLTQNYYLYSQNGKFTVIPWDYNMSLGGFSAGGDATTIPIDEPVMGVNIEDVPLIDNLLEVEEYKTKYHEYVQQLNSYLEKFEPRVTELANIIRPYVEKDPTKFYTMEQFEENIRYSDINNTDEVSSASQNQKNNEKPEGMLPEVPKGQLPPGKPNGDKGMMGRSIINYVRDRVENIKKQLSGELPTTGNITMNNKMGFRR